jgi:hypothetical protein
VGDAGEVEQAPFVLRDRALVADRERDQDACGRRRAEMLEETPADRFARLLDPVRQAVALAEQAPLAALAHVAGRADAALEEPRLVVEALRVHVAVRPAQAHGKEPALARMHGLGEDRRVVLLCRGGAAVPGQQQLARHMALGVRRLHVELEAHAALAERRQACHHAGHVDVAALELRRKTVGEALRREQRSPGEAERESKKDDGAWPSECRKRERGQRQREERRRQGRLLLQCRHACGEGQGGEGHLQSTRQPRSR